MPGSGPAEQRPTARALPGWGAWLLRRWCRAPYRDVVEGDLLELYAARLHLRGRRYARWRLLADLLSVRGTALARGTLQRIDARQPFPGSLEWFMNLLQDLRYAARAVWNEPAFSVVVVVTLALAIGANTAIFSVVDGVLLKPLPYDDPGAIVLVNARADDGSGANLVGASQSLFLKWREVGSAFESIAMYSAEASTLTSLEEPVRLNGVAVSPSLFPLLRVGAMRGRTFTPEEEHRGNDGVIVLGHRAWTRYFGRDPGILGQTIALDEHPRLVVGIMPPGFHFPDAGTDYWVPMTVEPPEAIAFTFGADAAPDAAATPSQPQRSHFEHFGRVIARLAPGVTPAMAAEQGQRLADGLHPEYTSPGGKPVVTVESLQQQMVGSVRRSLLMLMGAVGFVLLIACTNVANVVMARSAERRHETAVRAAIGAGWWDLTRLLFLESLLLSLLGAVAGLGLAWGGLRMLRVVGSEFLPRAESIALDGRSLLFTFAITGLTAVLFSIVPVRRVRSLELTRALKEEIGTLGRGFGRDVLRKVLVIAEVAASVVLLVGAGLLMSSFLKLTGVDMGYDVDNLLHLQIRLPASSYPTGATHIAYYTDLIERFEGLQGVQAATVASQPPDVPANIQIAMQVRTSEQPPDPEQRPQPVGVRLVEPGYFETLGTEPLRGRVIDRDDRSETQPVVVLSESGARNLFGDTDPVGQKIAFLNGQAVEIVGVVRDMRVAGVDPKPQPDIFIPYQQAPEKMVAMLFRTAHLLVRTRVAPLNLLPAIRAQVRGSDPGVVLLNASTIRDQLAASVAEPRFYTSLVSSFAALAVILAAVGVYGLLSYSVQQGVRDTAIRRALGAPVQQVLRGVVLQGMLVTSIGLAVGMAGALAFGRVLRAMLYEIEPTDPAAFVAVAVLFVAVALAAVWVPARRATRIDPMEVLRYE